MLGVLPGMAFPTQRLELPRVPERVAAVVAIGPLDAVHDVVHLLRRAPLLGLVGVARLARLADGSAVADAPEKV